MRVLFFCLIVLFFSACSQIGQDFAPSIQQSPGKTELRSLGSAFSSLTTEEKATDWGREFLFGISFARDLDFYRAITCFKRALVLIPEDNLGRSLQAHYHIIQSYYWGGKYKEVTEVFQESPLQRASPSFPAYQDLLIMLRHSYEAQGRGDEALRMEKLLKKEDPDKARDQKLSSALRRGDMDTALSLAAEHPRGSAAESTLNAFECQRLSVQKARTLNALLPGAGYLYVGQTQAAVTSFALNTLFIAASYYFFKEGNWAAGVITLSFEGGWYFGGINGAGIAASEYNEKVYESLTGDLLWREKWFPLFTLQFSF